MLLSDQGALHRVLGTKIMREWTDDGIDACTAFARALRLEIAFVNGVFDIFHPGHLALLEYAASCGSSGDSLDRGPFLIVGINSSDNVVRKLKGVSRPYFGARSRANVLATIGIVDLVVGFREDTPEMLIKRIKPDYLVKGEEYKGQHLVYANRGRPSTIPGADFVTKNGGKLKFCPMQGEFHSSTLYSPDS